MCSNMNIIMPSCKEEPNHISVWRMHADEHQSISFYTCKHNGGLPTPQISIPF